jgi:hypothetical protein
MRNQDKRQPVYGDTDAMPFGKHKGEPMQDVPARYLRWLWTEGEIKDYSKTIPEHDIDKQRLWILEKVKLANYIWNSREALEQELGDTFI